MNRKVFLASVAGMIALPFSSKPEAPELPKDRLVSVIDVEEYVRKEVEFQLRSKLTVKGSELLKVLKYNGKK